MDENGKFDFATAGSVLNSVACEYPELGAKWARLVSELERLNGLGGIGLAFSGGADSMVLLQICRGLGLDVFAVHFSGAQFASGFTKSAVAWLENHEIPHRVMEHNALVVPEVKHSDPRRCYYCKRHILGGVKAEAGSRALCDGTNASDLQGYRPGLEALRELGVNSPYVSAGMSKPEVLALARILGLDLPKISGQNCLLTRFEYGVSIEEEQLRRIEKVEAELLPIMQLEDAVGELKPLQYRLRYVAEPAAQGGSAPELHIGSAEPLPDKLLANIQDAFSQSGLAGAPIRVMPKVSGYFDRDLK